ncbi:DUF2867 domain-containing protein [Nocardia arthritidis]|uniref:DUF2867 domain-containing protein n=1 Tax=Nocardia arthritidis TaxID=228602 RepID=A0A6G9YDB5_9NOCA|nr:DUF2867 domain-containing protein [Nocardia arthritidis]QIS11192.1 DUF2867 domain-containing protein [Nocardia arthritidis]
MRLPVTEHTGRPWRIHEIAPDFQVYDVWSFRTPGAGPDDFPAMLAALRATGGPGDQPPLVRLLFAVRWRLGALFGWDDPDAAIGRRIPALRDRLPQDLRATTDGGPLPDTPFTTMYELHDEAANEMANMTVHTVMHLGWVPAADGEYELRMAVLVKPNGLFGRLYMTGIGPFRFLIVYPALTRQWERAWLNRGPVSRNGADR